MLVDPDELNYLIYRYFLESGFEHAAHSFFHEANLSALNIQPNDVPVGLLLSLLQKAIQMLDIEIHLDQHGGLHFCDRPLSLLRPHSCLSLQQLNATLPRLVPRIREGCENGKVFNSLDCLPKPILFESKKSVQTLYNTIGTDENLPELTDLFRQELKEEPAPAPTIPTQQIEIGQSSAISAVQYIVDKLPALQQQQVSADDFQRHVQSIQQAAEVEETNLIEAAAKFRTSSVFLKAGTSQVNVCKVISIGLCSCKDMICSCKGQSNIIDAFFVGNNIGELFVITLGGGKQKRSQNLLKRQAAVVILESQKNRLFCIQKDGSVNVLKLSAVEGHLVVFSLLQDVFWFGGCTISQLVFSPSGSMCAAAVNGLSTPLIYDIQQKRPVSMFPPSESFPNLKETDGIGYLPLAKLADNQTVLQHLQSQVTYVLFINNDEIFFIRDDGIVQINELSEGIIFRRIYKQKPFSAFSFSDRVLIFCRENLVIDLQFNQLQQSWMFDEILQEFIIDDIAMIQGHGILCRQGQHLFLVTGVKPNKQSLMISQDWQLQAEGEFGQMVVAGKSIFVAQGGSIWEADVESEGAEIREVFTNGRALRRICAGDQVVCCVSDTGIINLQFQVELDV